MYKIKIEKFVENPQYSEELKQYGEANRYGSARIEPPAKYVSVSVTDTEITDEQFAAVRKALIEVM